MKKIRSPRLSRRDALKAGLSSVAALSAFETLVSGTARAQINTTTNPAEKLLFVFTATGGGSITDSFLAVHEDEVPTPGNAPNLICYAENDVWSQVTKLGGATGGALDPTALSVVDVYSPVRNVFGPGTQYYPSDFATAHLDDLAVMTLTNTSVNHFVAQGRALTGAGVNRGRSIGEAVAEQYGQDLVLPFVNMGTGGYLEAGVDPDLPGFAHGQVVNQPFFFALGTDGVRGMAGAPGAAPHAAPQLGNELDRARELMARARNTRRELEDVSAFGQTFQCSPARKKFLLDQTFAETHVEPEDLITNLLYISEVPLQTYGLELTPAAQEARDVVEAMPGGGTRSAFTDPFISQVVLAYLLARYGYTAAQVLGPSFSADAVNLDVNPPLSFDFSHNSHIACQATMWSRVLDGVNKLIGLLKATPVQGGGTMWDRSMIYIASDFGRDKTRTNPGVPIYDGTDPQNPVVSDSNTGHNLNNGAVLVSPLLHGGRVYGGIDKDTLLTHGFDRVTGEATPGNHMAEGNVYATICKALGVDFTGIDNYAAPVMIKTS